MPIFGDRGRGTMTQRTTEQESEITDMGTLILKSMQWTDLDHIADVKPIGEHDAECLEEIRLVLQRHNALDRFGIALLHHHFDLADDEMMLETTAAEVREHVVR